MTDPGFSIQHIVRQQRQLVITWKDGHRSTFHYIWLRDNCACAECCDRSGGHRYLELGDIYPDITPDDVSLDARGFLQIKWNKNGHLTSYDANWLRQHCYSTEALVERRHQPVLRDSQLNDSIQEWDYRLESGQAVVLDNHRVMHARTAFNGDRHIRQCHVDRDEFFSRLRALHRRLGTDN